MNFKYWLELNMTPQEGPSMTPQSVNAQQKNPLIDDGEVERIFTYAKQRLTGGMKTEPTLSLNRITNGPNGAADMLKPIFNRLSELGDPWANQVNDARNWLKQLSNGNLKNSASATIGNLLAKLFGKKVYEKVMKQPAPIDSSLENKLDFENPNKQQQSMENPVVGQFDKN